MSRVSLNKSQYSQYGSRRVRKISSVRFVWSARAALFSPFFFTVSVVSAIPPIFLSSPSFFPFRPSSLLSVSRLERGETMISFAAYLRTRAANYLNGAEKSEVEYRDRLSRTKNPSRARKRGGARRLSIFRAIARGSYR